MAVLKYKDANGVWQKAPGLKYMENGVSKTTVMGKYRDANGKVQRFFCIAPQSDDGDSPTTGATVAELAVGSSVFMNVGGVSTEFIVVHQGRPSELYDVSCDGAWLLTKDICEVRKWNDGKVNNNYAGSTIHTYLNGEFLNLFDAGVAGQVKEVILPYTEYSASAMFTGANGLPTKVFLLGLYEVGGTPNYNAYYLQDGDKLDYFLLGTDDNAAKMQRRAAYNGADDVWWLRTPYKGSASGVMNVTATGDLPYKSATTAYGIRPCLILPATARVDDNGNVIA